MSRFHSYLKTFIVNACFFLVSAIFIACAPGVRFESTEDTEPEMVAVSEDALVTDQEWAQRMSGLPDVHLVSLPSNLTAYSQARVYQFGDLERDPYAYTKWPALPHNMECGPASVQTIERLTGRPGVTCDYKKVVSGCESYPSVHSECRAIGACGKTGYDSDSFDGSAGPQVQVVLESLGYEVKLYQEGGERVSLSIVKSAINENHPMIVALSPEFYASEAYGKETDISSHFVVIVGYGSACQNKVFNSEDASASDQGYVYMLDPGWAAGGMVCISENAFNTALEEEWTKSTYTGLEVTRPGFSDTVKATWYPPGTLLEVDDEYYYIKNPDDNGRMQYSHASPEALSANRISKERAISASKNVLACGMSLGEMDSAKQYREYRNDETGAIYLVDLANRRRGAFINYEAYLSYNGDDEWRDATDAEIKTWSSYRDAGLIGLASGVLVMTDQAGVSTVWVVSRSVNDSRVRLPIVNESAAQSFGYDVSKLGKSSRFSAVVPYQDLDAVAGPEGQMLTEELSLDCKATRCLAAIECFANSSNIGGGEELEMVGDGACGDCQSSEFVEEEDDVDEDTGIGGAAVESDSGGSVSRVCVPNATQICQCLSNGSVLNSVQVCMQDGSGFSTCPCEASVSGSGGASSSLGIGGASIIDPSISQGGVVQGGSTSQGEGGAFSGLGGATLFFSEGGAPSGIGGMILTLSQGGTPEVVSSGGTSFGVGGALGLGGTISILSQGGAMSISLGGNVSQGGTVQGGSASQGGTISSGGAISIAGSSSLGVGGSSSPTWNGEYEVIVSSPIETWDFFSPSGIISCQTSQGEVNLPGGIVGCSFFASQDAEIEFNIRATQNGSDLFGAYEPWGSTCPDGQAGCAQRSGVYYSRWNTIICRILSDGSTSTCIEVANQNERLTDGNSVWNGLDVGGCNFNVELP